MRPRDRTSPTMSLGAAGSTAAPIAPRTTAPAERPEPIANRLRRPPESPVSPEEILVVTPALDEAPVIEGCLRSLLEGDDFAGAVTFIVSDGGSRDGTREIVRRLAGRFPNLRLHANPGRLQSAGVNSAVRTHALPRHRLLIRCDAHAQYPPGYLRRVAEALRTRPEAASVAVVMDAGGAGAFRRAAAWVVDTPLGSGGAAHRGGARSGWVDHGHHAGFRLDWFRSIGGYDESFICNEDAEFDRRLTEAGGAIWLESRLRVAYVMRPDARALWRQYWRYGRGRARTVLKHRMRPRLRQMAPVANLLLLALAASLAPWRPLFLVYPIAYAGALTAVSVACAASLRSPAGAWAGPALGAMHCAWGAGFLSRIVEGPEEARRRREGRG